MALCGGTVLRRRCGIARLASITLARGVFGETVVALGSSLGGSNALLRVRVRETWATDCKTWSVNVRWPDVGRLTVGVLEMEWRFQAHVAERSTSSMWVCEIAA